MADDSESRGGPGRAGDPERFGPYRVEGRIGAGGMGVVYRALDEALQRPVALKTLIPALAADPEFVARFKREAQSAAALNHPNITQIYAIGQQGPIPFFAMEFIEGTSLEAVVRERKRIAPVEAAGFILQAARGLRHAAQRHLIHRDVKPSNLMLTGDGVVKVTDFGLAKAAKSESQLTATGEVLGSPGYISPEQAEGRPIDARSDIYSLGATFYHLVTGKLPFEAPTPVAMIIKHMNEPLRSPRAIHPDIPYAIAAIIQKMMAKRPDQRFQDYDALIREIDRALASVPAGNAAVDVAGASAHTRAARPSDAAAPAAAAGRNGSRLATALFIALGAMVVFGILQHRQAARQEEATAAVAGAIGPGVVAGPPRDSHLESPLRIDGTFTRQPGGAAPRARGERQGAVGIDDLFRERLQQKSRANLAFLSNDHEVLPDGRIRVLGRVQNTGGRAATQARVRIRILADPGRIVAEGEASLTPPIVPPGAFATFELPIDYTGPVGTIKAELVWVD